ncbi:MAG TPA: hypothetical protein VF505_04730, partial [Thermoanaerobaculia bacterium]
MSSRAWFHSSALDALWSRTCLWFPIVVPRVLLAATFEVSARLASLLARRDVLDVDTSLNVVTAIRKVTTTAYDVVVL